MDTPATDRDDETLLEAGRLLFARECTFVRGVVSLDGLPDPDLPEVAFAGRSNVGKSSLINALTGRTTLARTSHTPGRTQQLNFFDLGGRLMLVDMPGYGYAKAAKPAIAAWTRVLRTYLAGRPALKRLCLLIDARHGLKANDAEMMAMLDAAAVVYQIVLTKADQLAAAALAARVAETEAALTRHPAAFPAVVATSARKNAGIAELRAELATLATPEPIR